jgi:hypothetical protein
VKMNDALKAASKPVKFAPYSNANSIFNCVSAPTQDQHAELVNWIIVHLLERKEHSLRVAAVRAAEARVAVELEWPRFHGREDGAISHYQVALELAEEAINAKAANMTDLARWTYEEARKDVLALALAP